MLLEFYFSLEQNHPQLNGHIYPHTRPAPYLDFFIEPVGIYGFFISNLGFGVGGWYLYSI